VAKIIDPDNYVPHNLPIPGIEKAKLRDLSTPPAEAVSLKERDEFDKMISEMRGEPNRASKESCE
jgi:hypothetical protein